MSCNSFNEGNNIGYTAGLIKKYGPQVIDLLLLQSKQFKKLNRFEYEALIAHYKKEVKKLMESKTLKE